MAGLPMQFLRSVQYVARVLPANLAATSFGL